MKKTKPKKPNHKPVRVSILSSTRRRRAAHVDELLDEALEETFPASDPTAPAVGDDKQKAR